jgi:hypothetical protein
MAFDGPVLAKGKALFCQNQRPWATARIVSAPDLLTEDRARRLQLVTEGAAALIQQSASATVPDRTGGCTKTLG